MKSQTCFRVSMFCILTAITLALLAIGLVIYEHILSHDAGWFGWPHRLIVLLAVAAVVFALVGVRLRRRGHCLAHDTPSDFLTHEDESAVIEAIRSFENKTSGEIRVHLEYTSQESSADAAKHAFERMGMTQTAERNGVLFFVAVHDRRFAVIGDHGINDVVADDFWSVVVKRVEDHFAQERYAAGLIEGIRIAGDALSDHFPPSPDDINELPDEVSRSPRE